MRMQFSKGLFSFFNCNPNTQSSTTVTGVPHTAKCHRRATFFVTFTSTIFFHFSSHWRINDRVMEYRIPEGSRQVLVLSGFRQVLQRPLNLKTLAVNWA